MGFIIKRCKKCKLDKVFTSPKLASLGICEPCYLKGRDYMKNYNEANARSIIRAYIAVLHKHFTYKISETDQDISEDLTIEAIEDIKLNEGR